MSPIVSQFQEAVKRGRPIEESLSVVLKNLRALLSGKFNLSILDSKLRFSEKTGNDFAHL